MSQTQSKEVTDTTLGVSLPNPEAEGATTALVPVTRSARTQVVNLNALKPDERQRAESIAAARRVADMKLGEAVTFGVPEQAALGQQIQELLANFTRDTTPAAFAFVDQIEKFVKEDLKFEEIDELIKKSLEETWWTKTVDLVGGAFGMKSSTATRLKNLDDQVRELLKKKVKSLKEFCGKINKEFEDEVERLLALGVITDQAAKAYRGSVGTLRAIAAASEMMLVEGFAEEARRIEAAKASGDILEISDVETYQMTLRQFDNRSIALAQEYSNVVARIKKIGFAQNAVAEQLSGKINGFQGTMNGIADGLLTLAIAFEVKSAAESDALWSKMDKLLSVYSTDLLDKTLSDAIKQQGLRNLQAAQMLKGTISKLTEIGNNAKSAMEDARQKNEEARKLIKEGVEELTKPPEASELQSAGTGQQAKAIVHGGQS